MPITPPFSAHFLSTSSGFMRLVGHSPRAPAWVMKIGFLHDLDRVQRGLVARVGDVDGDAQPVHADDGGPTELGEATIALLAQTRAQRIGFAIGDARRADAQPITGCRGDPTRFRSAWLPPATG